MVYSTCALNPVEDEAVVAAILRASEGAIRVVDASSELPALKRRPGITTWRVPDRECNLFDTWSSVPKEKVRGGGFLKWVERGGEGRGSAVAARLLHGLCLILSGHCLACSAPRTSRSCTSLPLSQRSSSNSPAGTCVLRCALLGSPLTSVGTCVAPAGASTRTSKTQAPSLLLC